VIATAWPQYREVPDWLAGVDPPPVVADGRRLIAPEAVEQYLGVGFSRAACGSM